jgi:hypothetical protein
MLGWREDDLADETIAGACTYVVGAEACGASEDLTVLEGRVLCEEHREEVLLRRRERLKWA